MRESIEAMDKEIDHKDNKIKVWLTKYEFQMSKLNMKSNK